MSQLFQFTSSKSRRTVKELQFRDQGEPELVGRCSVLASQRGRERGFFIFKKFKISKIYVCFGKFQKYTPVAL